MPPHLEKARVTPTAVVRPRQTGQEAAAAKPATTDDRVAELDDGTARETGYHRKNAANSSAARIAETSRRVSESAPSESAPNESVPHDPRSGSGARGFGPYHPDNVIPEGSDELRWNGGAVADGFDGMRAPVRHVLED